MIPPDPIRLSLLQEQLEGVAEEMGQALARSAFSPNIRVRRDFSCALFAPNGELLAQAAHVPVHLGSMPDQIAALLERFEMVEGDLYLGNDPFEGGTHLPDLTMIMPVFEAADRQLLGLAAVRAHHADVGGAVPGSMADQPNIHGEGVRIPLVRWRQAGEPNEDLSRLLLANLRNPVEREGDLLAQEAACRIGREGLRRTFQDWLPGSIASWTAGLEALLNASEARLQRELAVLLPAGREAEAEQILETPTGSLVLRVRLSSTSEGRLQADLEGCDDGADCSLNATRAVALAALVYCTNCLLARPHPINGGFLRGLKLRTRPGSAVHADYPQAVAGGNVETSQRLVDLILLALAQLAPGRIPAAAAGSMNSLSFGFANGKVHYETCGGGYGGHPDGPGASAQQVHMTNTLSTPNEVLEEEFPLVVLAHRVRRGSGGAGVHPGGDGIVRRLRLLETTTVTLLSTRRKTTPYGLAGGSPGAPGQQAVRTDPRAPWQPLPGCFSLTSPPGAEIEIETPGGGGWGEPHPASALQVPDPGT